MNTISQQPMGGISPNFGYRCICVHRCADKTFISKVKVTAGSDLRNRVNIISSYLVELISPKLSHMFLGQETY